MQVTQTSMNFLCNLAQAQIEAEKSELENLSFLTVTVKKLGEESETLVERPTTSTEKIRQYLNDIAFMNMFCAYGKESIKAIQEEMAIVENSRLKYDIDPPKMREIASVTTLEEDLKLAVLEAECATYGKFLHKDSPYDKALKRVLKARHTPNVIESNGIDTLSYFYDVALPIDEIQDIGNDYKAIYRQKEREVNKLKAEIKDRELKAIKKAKETYDKENDEYWKEKLKAVTDFDLEKAEKLAILGKKKIEIPEKFEALVNNLNTLCKQD